MYDALVTAILTKSSLDAAHDDRHFDYLAAYYRLVVDRDDTREHGYGVYYMAAAQPLRLERMMPVP